MAIMYMETMKRSRFGNNNQHLIMICGRRKNNTTLYENIEQSLEKIHKYIILKTQ